MPRLHATVLQEIAPLVAEAFRTDPEVDDLLDPALLIRADEEACAAAVVERIQLVEVMSRVEVTEEKSAQEDAAEGAAIAVLVMDNTSATFYRVPDPRTDPRCWPWMALESGPV